MTSKEALEAELETIDSKLNELSSNSSGFKLSAEIKRLRAALFSLDSRSSEGAAGQFTSSHDRAKRIQSLQRERERVLVELSKYEMSDHDKDTPATSNQN